MKKILVSILVVTAAASGRVMAQDYKFGLGLRIGNDAPSINNSVVGRFMLNESEALEGMVSFGTGFGIGVLYEKFKPLGESGFKWFYGAGAYVGFHGGDTYVGPTGI